jgi:drug/metabolite transporter (DMT)-like permease
MNGAPALSITIYATLLVAAACAAAGQVLLKLGATGRASLTTFINVQIGSGLVLYVLAALLWTAALSKAPLSVAYPFTVLTFVLVYVASIFLLGERPAPHAIIGVVLVLAGLAAIVWTR